MSTANGSGTVKEDKAQLTIGMPMDMFKRLQLASDKMGGCGMAAMARFYIGAGLDMAKIKEPSK